MKIKTKMSMSFEEYLKNKCYKETNALDDNFPELWERWFSELDSYRVGKYADEWFKLLTEE